MSESDEMATVADLVLSTVLAAGVTDLIASAVGDRFAAEALALELLAEPVTELFAAFVDGVDAIGVTASVALFVAEVFN